MVYFTYTRRWNLHDVFGIMKRQQPYTYPWISTDNKLTFFSNILFEGDPKPVVQVENMREQFHPPAMLLSEYLERIRWRTF
jgi:hypothetical protein